MSFLTELNGLFQGRYSVVGAQPAMEIVAKENWVTVLDHEDGQRKEEFVDDPMTVPRKIMERWNPQSTDDLPDAFCGTLNFHLAILKFM